MREELPLYYKVFDMTDDELSEAIIAICNSYEWMIAPLDPFSLSGGAYIAQEFNVNKSYEDYDCLGPNYWCHENQELERFLAFENEDETHEKAICRAVVYFELIQNEEGK